MRIDQRWRDRAACVNEDPEVFYFEDPRSIETAKLVCRGCPVQKECVLDAAAMQDWWGIRGGLIGPTRKRIHEGHATAPPINTRHGVDHEITRLTREGWTATNVAGYLNVSTRTVERALARMRKRAAA